MTPHLSFRLILGDDIALGPGKVRLLEAIRETGSISAAGRSMNMSYKRAWHLVNTMNRCFSSSLVEASKGGAHGGGAVLTPLADEVISLYRRLESRARKAAEADMAKLSQHLAHSDPDA
ncbi:MAG TPA: winged helix-turn-helix domain-containing protein [Thiobacillus sp.]|uniref:winged helix-turn-helix domain-containing protein n=1 Tax=Acidovorax sp. TaxID=1872122 RepID=UPI000BC6F933|nr:winged helix-turn-helix domain-containing protein [Acidovorax sp.]OYY62650.1 MAG: LysR family transcriptional regulator [Hydrogenophilales bacterium 28-61-11]OYZ58375.1 MAG: LysR family transcriptional regulator [Hydrogenophilales bacterium 16-61-112]OZA45364.1 MAG: LysR family transcriptional regulator [Hydrogenophilales bacterium 17-61-76]HQT30599.1 winged helix-turn-helix domain-containing protein [Thiobacillus sp.]HQT69973.1 winged helix-turn-helix domain-containing protein [Thiobacillu